MCLYFARRRIKKKFNYDIDNICPIFFIENVTIPTVYIISRNDKFVHPAHTLYLAYKQHSSRKIIYICEKATHSYESFSYENKLTAAIKSVLFGTLGDIKNIFNVYTYTKVFNELMEKYAYEFHFIDSLINKKLCKKNKIIDEVKKFIYFKYQSKISLASSSFNLSTIDSIRGTNTRESDYMQYELSRNTISGKYSGLKEEQNGQDDHHALSEENGGCDENEMTDEYEYPFHDVNDIIMSNPDDLTKKSPFKSYDMNNVSKFNQIYHESEDNHGKFKIFHMQSARSSLKSKKNTYKKSLTWDSKLQSSVTYFKGDYPFKLQKN